METAGDADNNPVGWDEGWSGCVVGGRHPPQHQGLVRPLTVLRVPLTHSLPGLGGLRAEKHTLRSQSYGDPHRKMHESKNRKVSHSHTV